MNGIGRTRKRAVCSGFGSGMCGTAPFRLAADGGGS
jgi:hypothetical protein